MDNGKEHCGLKKQNGKQWFEVEFDVIKKTHCLYIFFNKVLRHT